MAVASPQTPASSSNKVYLQPRGLTNRAEIKRRTDLKNPRVATSYRAIRKDLADGPVVLSTLFQDEHSIGLMSECAGFCRERYSGWSSANDYQIIHGSYDKNLCDRPVVTILFPEHSEQCRPVWFCQNQGSRSYARSPG